MKTFNVEEGAATVIAALEAAGFEAYAVGGCVRDSLLGEQPKDWDITTSAHPEEIKQIFARTFDTGIQHGTISVRERGNTYEVTTYRIDGEYADHRRPDRVEFTASLREDLARRDFTINAMAYHPQRGLVDYFGGVEDLARERIRCVGDPHLRFEEDALRMLRALRFSARLGFSIEDETYAAISDKSALLEKISKERIQEELNQILLSERPEGIREVAATHLMPWCIPNFEETDFPYESLRKVPAQRILRWSMLLQRQTPEQTECTLRELKFDNESRRSIVRLAAFRSQSLPAEAEEMRRFLHALGREHFPELYALRTALEGPTPALQQAYRQYELQKEACLQIQELSISGADLRELGVPSGPQMGAILEALLDLVLREPSLNANRDTMLALAKEQMSAFAEK